MNRNWMPVCVAVSGILTRRLLTSTQFGLGSRTCLGKNVSILEMTKLVPRLIRDFDFKLDGNAAAPDGAWTTANAWFVKPRNFYVGVEPRSSSSRIC